jgi:hypothetical protein
MDSALQSHSARDNPEVAPNNAGGTGSSLAKCAEPDSSERPIKRARSDSPEILLDLPRHEKFWYSDGNVVLEIDGMLFKLHKSRLASQSRVLSALFDAESDDEVDGYALFKVISVQRADFEVWTDILENPL